MTPRDRFEVRDLTRDDRAALERIAAEVVPDAALPTHARRGYGRAATMIRLIARGRLRVVAVEQTPAAGEQAAKETQP